MIRILIVEDEVPAARRLERLIAEVSSDIEIVKHVDSVEDAVDFFNSGENIDLAFFDIQLADGISFDIFTKTTVKIPVIFTTAYDHYALKAFKVNSVDYLLKPIEPEELRSAMDKYREVFTGRDRIVQDITEVIRHIAQHKNEFRKRFLVKTAGRLTFINCEDIAFFFSDDGNTFIVTNQNDRFLLDETLEEIEPQVDPDLFFRVNRKMLLSLNAIKRIEPHFNNRFLLTTEPTFEEEVVVSRQRSAEFKAWLDR